MGKRAARRVEKPWGEEEIFAETDQYLGKILTIRAGECLSLQYHEEKDETIRVLEGRLDLLAGSDAKDLRRYELETGMVFHIPPLLVHRFIAVTDCTVLEVSSAAIDDVVRLEDRYGREGSSAP